MNPRYQSKQVNLDNLLRGSTITEGPYKAPFHSFDWPTLGDVSYLAYRELFLEWPKYAAFGADVSRVHRHPVGLTCKNVMSVDRRHAATLNWTS